MPAHPPKMRWPQQTFVGWLTKVCFSSKEKWQDRDPGGVAHGARMPLQNPGVPDILDGRGAGAAWLGNYTNG